MSSLRIQMQDAQWFNWGYTTSLISGTKFGMNIGTNSATTSVVANFVVNRRIKVYSTSTIYATISEASLSGSLINISVTPDSGSLVSTVSSAYLSILTPTNTAIPSGSVVPANVVLQTGSPIYGVDSVGTDAYAITLSPSPGSYTDGMVINFKAGTANTGGATLDLNGIGPQAIVKLHDQALATGDIEAGQIITVIYDLSNTRWQMQSQTAVTPGGGTVTSVASGQGLTGGPITTTGTLACVVPFQNCTIYASNGSTTFTTPAYSTLIYVQVWGAGGGGGGGSAGGNGSGGGGGGYSAGFLSVAGSTGYAAVVGTAGSSGATSASGGNGGNSTFTVGGTIVTGGGGTGGPFNAGPGNAGSGSNGTINLPGRGGQSSVAGGGFGGAAFQNPGEGYPGGANGNGGGGGMAGCGGGGGGIGGATLGGAGFDGMIIVWY